MAEAVVVGVVAGHVVAAAAEAAEDVEAAVVVPLLRLEGPLAPLEGALGSPPCL